MKKLLALLITLVLMVSALVGCGEEEVNETVENNSDVAFNVIADTVSDSSDMPDWTGKTHELRVWYANGTAAPNRNDVAENDVVTPELFRVTGVKFSAENSFDNGGDLMDGKIAKVIATNDWPDVIYGPEASILEDLIEQDMVYDLTDLIPKYMPHLDAMMKKGDFLKSTREDGKIYGISLYSSLEYAYPEIEPEKIARVAAMPADSGCIYVRDDILKQVKPEAYTQAELTEKFVNNGTFTEEEVLNASINSKEEFYDFLRAIKKLGVKVGNREVFPTYAFSGTDNWDLLMALGGNLEGYNPWPYSSGGSNYFTYYDNESKKIEYMWKQPFFKELLRELTTLVQEDVLSSDSLIDNRPAFEEKCASGQYAILYGQGLPNIENLNRNAQGYKYRKVIINIPFNTEKFVPLANIASSDSPFVFIKQSIAEEDLPQILRYFDYRLSDVGQKLTMWGPRSAGLFEEDENGVRRFTNKEVEAQSVRDEANGSLLYYGLQNKQWPPSGVAVNRWNPKLIYDFEPSEGLLNKFYSTGLFRPFERIQGKTADVWNFTKDIEGAKQFWNARTDFEKALTKILTAQNDEEFETLYTKMVETSERNGMTEETLEQINEFWVNNLNKDYMENLK